MLRASCLYGRVTGLTVRHVAQVCTRGYAKAANEKKKGKGGQDTPKEPKVRKPYAERKRTRTPKDETRPYLHRIFNEPTAAFKDIPSITRLQLQELLRREEKFYLIDLRTDAEMTLSGDAPITSAYRMPTPPLTHLNTYKPPKEKVDKTAKGGKKSKKNAKQNAKKKSTQVEPPKVDPLERDMFLPYYKMMPSAWLSKYKFPKLDVEDRAVFISSGNIRSSALVKSATNLGFKNVRFLEGGSREWNKYYNILGK